VKTTSTQGYEDQLVKATGESIHFTVDCPDKTLSFEVYRKDSPSSPAVKIATLPAGQTQYDYPMPSGGPQEFRFVFVSVDSTGNSGPGTNEIQVLRAN